DGHPDPYYVYIGKSPVTVIGLVLNHTFGPGVYVVRGENWFYANYSIPFASVGNTTSTSTSTPPSNVTLSVSVNPSTYTIQFSVNGAVVKQGTGSLSYQFPKNTTVTIQILNGNTQVYQQSYKLTQDTTLYFNFGNDNTIWNPAQTGNLTLQFFAVDPTTGYFKSPLAVDTVQVVGINNSVTKTASSVSQVTFTNMPFGHYQITAQKSGYNPVSVWVYFGQSQETFRIGLVPVGSNLNPLGYIGTGNYNGTNTNTWQNLVNQNPPAPTVSGNFYGFHFIVTDANGNPASAQVQVLAIKTINKVLWQDSATYPLAVVNVQNGSAYWYITEQDLNQALQYAGFWESFGGFKIVAGSNSMFVPAQFAYDRFYEMRIVLNQNIFGNTGNIDIGYQGGLFGSTQMAQLIGLLMPLMVLSMIAGIIKEAVKKR
ncbi:MAG: hypothetical protein JHC26_04410, partial [Thermofilum sp.]|uniref:hypothetical protein n=1 Tax=Thermofilum sp. TaxID=1961369 RepID=UPI002582756B